MALDAGPMIDWDGWRNSYDAMTYAEQVRWYDEVWAKHPVQDHFDLAAAERFFDRVNARDVIEIGGWRGELAAGILPEWPGIESWTNVEICRGAVADPVTHDPRYRAFVPGDWVWNVPGLTEGHDTLVASHVIEHMTGDQLALLFAAFAPGVESIYLASPLDEYGKLWDGYVGSHILELGWRDIRLMLAELDFAEWRDLRTVEVRCFGRR